MNPRTHVVVGIGYTGYEVLIWSIVLTAELLNVLFPPQKSIVILIYTVAI